MSRCRYQLLPPFSALFGSPLGGLSCLSLYGLAHLLNPLLPSLPVSPCVNSLSLSVSLLLLYVCVCLSLSLSLFSFSLSLFLSLSLALCLSLSLSFWLSALRLSWHGLAFLPNPLRPSLPLCPCVNSLYLSVSLCISLYLSVSLCLFLPLYVSLSLSLSTSSLSLLAQPGLSRKPLSPSLPHSLCQLSVSLGTAWPLSGSRCCRRGGRNTYKTCICTGPRYHVQRRRHHDPHVRGAQLHARRAVHGAKLRPISVLRFWSSEGLTRAES